MDQPELLRPILDLTTGSVAGWEVTAAHGLRLPAHGLEPALARLGATTPGQFVVVRIPAPSLAVGRLRALLDRTSSLTGLLLIITRPVAPDALTALADARDRGALVGVEPGSECHWRYAVPHVDVVSVRAPTGGSRAEWSRALLHALALGDKMATRVLMDGIDDPERLAESRDAGVHLGQGEAVGGARPVPPAPFARPAGHSVARELAEPAPSVSASESLAALMDLSLAHAENEWLVLVDSEGRPLTLVERAALLRGEPYERSVDVVDPAATLASLARYAVQRPRPYRSRPLTVCDDAGRYVGLLQMDRLLEALAA